MPDFYKVIEMRTTLDARGYTDTSYFEKQVSRYLNMGWTLVGGVCRTRLENGDFWLTQAMTKHTE